MSTFTSAIGVFRHIIDTVQKAGSADMTAEARQKLAMEALQKIAAGEDGVVGTEDDRLSPAVVQQIKSLIETDLARELVAHFQSLVTAIVPESVEKSPLWGFVRRIFGCAQPPAVVG